MTSVQPGQTETAVAASLARDAPARRLRRSFVDAPSAAAVIPRVPSRRDGVLP